MWKKWEQARAKVPDNEICITETEYLEDVNLTGFQDEDEEINEIWWRRWEEAGESFMDETDCCEGETFC
jgi:hypothetical protein